MTETKANKIILASKSPVRKALLKQTGLAFDIQPAHLDERSLIAARWAKEMPVEDIAVDLARLKAVTVSTLFPNTLVIGSDQLLMHKGQLVHKAQTPADAKQTLRMLQGSSHRLVSGAAVAENGMVLWDASDSASMSMRPLTEQMIDEYAKKAGRVLTDCVGCYALEGMGPWLFDKIEGDYFTILGLPLPALLGFLATKGYGPMT